MNGSRFIHNRKKLQISIFRDSAGTAERFTSYTPAIEDRQRTIFQQIL